MNTKFDIQKYKEQRDILKKRFEDEKTGDQNLFFDQKRLFKPLIETQEKTSRATQDKIASSQEATSNALVPFARELQKRIDQMETLQDLPYYNIPPGIENVPQSTPQKDRDMSIINVDLDTGLNITDLENLQDMNLPKQSVVLKNGSIEEAVKAITKNRKSLAQTKSKETAAGKKLDKKGEDVAAKEREICDSKIATLKIYEDSIRKIKGAEKFLKKSGEELCKPKPFKLKCGRGRPKMYPDTILYNN